MWSRSVKPDVVPFREAVLTDVLVIPLCGVVGRVAVEEGHWAVIVPDQCLEVLVFHHHIRQPSVGLLNEREVAPHIVRLAGKAGESGGVGGGVALTDDLVKPGRPLNIGSALAAQGQARPVEVLSGIEDIFQGVDQQIRLVPHTAVQVGEEAVVVVVDLEVVAGGFMEQHPAAAPKHLHIPLIEQRESFNHLLPQGFLPAHPAHEAVQGESPPFSGRQVCSMSNRSRERFSPRIAAAMPLIRRVRWAMVARTSCSVAA